MIRLSNAGTDVVVDVTTGAPTIVHWGAPLGAEADLATVLPSLSRPIVHGTVDSVAPVSTVPEHGSGFTGRPGLVGRRGGGLAWAPRFSAVSHHLSDDGTRLSVEAVDAVAKLGLNVTIVLDDVLHIWATVTNAGDRRYSLDGLTVTLPVAEHASELLSFEGRWSREFQPLRSDWFDGSLLAENRRGRTSHESPPMLFTGKRGFDEWSGEVWGAHLAWSGNHTMLAERLADGRRYLQAGELLHPGEVVLEPGESYTTPETIAAYSPHGLNNATQAFHRSLRALPNHPSTPRPVLLNTWEAVYFDHDTDKLMLLADAAADLGIERFVLDDGWFGSRRDDTKGLGDWWVSDAAYPAGLSPLIAHVTDLGMDFGIWVEPEMVNPDSDIFRAHPDWALATPGYEPVLGRQQLVLDLANRPAFDFILGCLDRLLSDHDISYVKWDMNRDHIHGSNQHGAAGTNAQTIALYHLLDKLRRLHPTVEFESCASGGARIDHEILKRTERVWTSDCNDALERQTIQRGASMLIPPELMGAHIGPTRAHTTGRTQSLSFRAATAMFGHLGVEWNVTKLTDEERIALQAVIALHKEHRELLHSGDVVRFDTDPAYSAHGVYAADRSEGIVAFAQLATAPSLTPPPLRLPGLDDAATYRIEHLRIPGERWGPARVQPSWLASGVELTGRQLAAHGVQPPTLHPESALLFKLTRI
ncbi:MAG: alpha-galactosidase [Ilumatobacter sp.]|jgi:alpha-galactosidase|uniref:alpha-galactosidase n=1 Tax=Ilumatobacter sp. TaxID=1967498 RepID=UPI001DC0E4E5|nr:alpha-galactosidase [Ilumatobacter sp.]MBT5275167.1 alpha-galactosidase [Ilumatobacter sp.]MBT5864492.1 alpha-galactosidase [Ilumatobacter sp.]MBT7430440.1 alpha-galactosidase [Ilumatobacter sp.]MDG0974964.1 alpha-galactosidase [Ilumatobacter sp.]